MVNTTYQMGFATMILQIGIVLGGSALILTKSKLKITFFYVTVALGLSGIA